MNQVRLSNNNIVELLRHPVNFDKVLIQCPSGDRDEFKKEPFDGDYLPINGELDYVGAHEANGGLHVAFSEGFFQVFLTVHKTCHPNVPFSDHCTRIRSFCDELDKIPRGAIWNHINGLDGDQFTCIMKEGKEFCVDSNYACHHLMVGLVVYMKGMITANI